MRTCDAPGCNLPAVYTDGWTFFRCGLCGFDEEGKDTWEDRWRLEGQYSPAHRMVAENDPGRET